MKMVDAVADALRHLAGLIRGRTVTCTGGPAPDA